MGLQPNIWTTICTGLNGLNYLKQTKILWSVRDIQSEMEELYGIDVSPAMISKITDKVVEATVEWQSRELDKIYPIVQTAKKIH